MYNILVLILVLFFSNKETHATTEVHFIMNDPQAASLYRGFQVGVKSISEEGSPNCYARVRFADHEDKICQGKGSYTQKRISASIVTGTMIGAIGYLIRPSLHENSTYAHYLVAFTALTSAAVTGIFFPSVYEGLGHFNSKVFIKYKNLTQEGSDSVNQLSSLEQEHADISVTRSDELNAKNGQPSEKLIAFGWSVKESIDLKTLIGKINTMRINNSFPKYTLYGSSSLVDSLNCVSFCIRLGHILGIPFTENSDLQTYTKQDPLSFVSMFMSAATPEGIARILLDDANLGGGSALKSWVNTDCSWWINTTMEQQAKSHSKARKGI